MVAQSSGAALMPSEKTPQRTMRWHRLLTFVEREAMFVTGNLLLDKPHAKADADRRELIEFCIEERNKAASEGFDDTATGLQHVIDDMQSFNQQLGCPPPLERIETPMFDCGNGMQGYLTAGI